MIANKVQLARVSFGLTCLSYIYIYSIDSTPSYTEQQHVLCFAVYILVCCLAYIPAPKCTQHTHLMRSFGFHTIGPKNTNALPISVTVRDMFLRINRDIGLHSPIIGN